MSSSPHWSPTTKRVVVVAFALFFLFVLTHAGEIVKPFVWAAILSFVLIPLVGLLEKRLRMHRDLAATIVFVALLATIFGGGRLLLPLAAAQAADLQSSLPTLVANAQLVVSDALANVGISEADDLIFQRAQDLTGGLTRMAVPLALGLLEFLLQLLVFLIATFFLLRDGPRLAAWVRGLVPHRYRHEILPLFSDVNALLIRYVRGQLALIAIMWTVTTIGLTVLGVPYSLLLGFMTGVLEIIPIVGPITAGAVASLVALGHPNPFGWSQIAYVGVVVIMYTVLRHSEDYFVIPLVIGRIVRLHPAIVIFSLLSGGAIFGLLGILLAVPFAATLRLVIIYVVAKLRDEDPFPALEQEMAAVEEPVHEPRRAIGHESAHP
ncbi:MAG: AI-2E family transporter [Chloroflexi bacterium]|nr:AI-2E family transporter [Chloroflexota bacterium]